MSKKAIRMLNSRNAQWIFEGSWVENVEVDDKGVHNLYKQLVSSGHAFRQNGGSQPRDQAIRVPYRYHDNQHSRFGDVDVITNQKGRKSMMKAGGENGDKLLCWRRASLPIPRYLGDREPMMLGS
ncbi:hypothetical protein OIU78_019498 [Salix suchowensis]|nr:hypothetical protein OIU78_019498 [Salix suchowensis]